MGDSQEELVRAVKRCQEGLKKYGERRSDTKLLYYLEKLRRLPVRVAHLERTGVGRTVNALRKIGGDVGVAARDLVARWKRMVVGEHRSEEEASERREGRRSGGKRRAEEGIDSASGASFAEALGMCEPSSSRGGVKKRRKKEKKEEQQAKHVDEEVEDEEEEEEEEEKEEVPELLRRPPAATISSLLPPITPHYRPLAVDTAPPRHRALETEALPAAFASKRRRTKVYSGCRSTTTGTAVPALFELCVRVLQDNVDALEYTGGVPYVVLRPVLERCNAAQLLELERHNPYLIEDTDELWRTHCQMEFKGEKRRELESWRETHLRCLDERAAKLRALTANIKLAQDMAPPVRTTKLAYMDAAAKPPRNVARKQAKNGTACSGGRAPPVAVVPQPGRRGAVRPKKAPLMLKSISSFKNRFKR